ncbi:hypothetical protein CRG98_013575 [Punica granatum]|uniref:Uncharacterized protein n=1 Tax=Punica granatum TaxID=22663 RepID=A0A2I0KCR1_PUNGR|nr:hypothetical protein CRG98_013575 [Punica granatum]
MSHGGFAKKFATQVSMELKVKHKSVPKHLIQRDDQVGAVLNLLNIESPDVRFVGIHGMGGIGKTALAKTVYNGICDHFNHSIFLTDVRESSRQHKGIEHLQKQILAGPGLGSGEVTDVDDGIMRMREMFAYKRVMIVLDGVDDKKHIQFLAGEASWFGSGSRIIITTRDQRVLEIKQQRILTFEVEEMKPEEALQLFSMHAFGKESPPNGYLSLSEEAVASTGRLPLALEVMGSHLRDKRHADWVDEIERLEKVPHRDVEEKLTISYEALDTNAKRIFLDIACFFINHERTNPTYMWEACEFNPQMGLKVLISMSLVKVVAEKDRDGIKAKRLWMHDQLRDLGRKIVRDESLKGVVTCSRLWMHEDALDVLRQEEGRENVEMLCLCSNRSAGGHTFTPQQLSGLERLRYLECIGANFYGDMKHLLPNLMWLSWRYCPWEFTGTDLHLRNLVILDLSWSFISENWSGWSHIGAGSKLKVLDLTGCRYLIKTPDLSKFLSLERLILADCRNLVEIDPSIHKLKGLKFLNVQGCVSLRGFPEELCSLDRLQVILHTGSLDSTLPFKIPELIGNLTSLLILKMNNVQIIELPESIGRLSRLRSLSLKGCSGFMRLPDSLADMKSLVKLDISWTGIVELPQNIGRLEKLELLYLNGCEKMKKLPDSIGDLRSLAKLHLSWSGITELPDTIRNLKNLRVTNIEEVKELEVVNFHRYAEED